MNTLLRAFILCYAFGVSIGAKGNFILTSPAVVDAGSTAYFTLTVFDVPRGGTVTLRLTHKSSNALIAESHVEVYNNYNMWVEMTIPPMSSDVSAKLHVISSFSNGYQIEAFKEVYIRHHTILTFIQTDKPLYKPGQTIRFRVLPMDNQLKPLDSSTVGDIWIEDPSSIRVAQWKNVKFTEGIKQFDLPLSDEPPLGSWAIKCVINQVTTTQTFKVQKYELPKFEVTIKLPKIIMADVEIIPIEICAKYTYGKIVEGNLKARITYKKMRWMYVHRESQNSIPSVEHQSQLAGCDIFQVNTDDLLMQTEEFGNSELEVFAEVTENATGITRNATKSFKTSHEHVILEFLNDNNYYKPKLAYTGILRAKKPDGSPAASEKIEICSEIHQKKRCLIFTTDKDGLIHFTIKPSSPYEHIKVDATTVNYENIYYPRSIWTLKLMKSTISMMIYPWSSPSGSYLHIQPTTEEFQCDKAQRVKVQYTAKRGTSIKFYHQVLSKGRIVQQGSHQRTFYSKIDELPYDFEDDSFKENSITNSSETTEIGEFILTFDTRATMSPKARLLIFYIRGDKEVVADSRLFHIKKCLQNKVATRPSMYWHFSTICTKKEVGVKIVIKGHGRKVNLDFRHEQQYPNTETAMLLSASPESLCGISMVDKSIRLLEDDKTFNVDRIFKIMDSYDTGKKSSMFPWRCFEGVYEETLTAPSMHSADAVLAFEEAGMVVISDLKIKSVSCKNLHLTRPMIYGRPIALVVPDARLGRTMDLAPDKVEVVSPAPQEEEIRSYFPETWLWELQTVGSSGETAITRQLPHSITEWVGGAVCVHPKTGLGMSDLSSITTFQPFFIDFQLPYSVIRDEKITLAVTVFNYLSECLPIKLSVEPSEDFVLMSDRRYEKVCVCGGKSATSRFPLRPVTLGRVNITVYAYSIEQDDEVCGDEITARLSARDAVTKELLVEAEGFPKEDIFNYFICPENTNGSFSTEVPLLPPDEVILDSARVYMTVTGDIMGPALSGLKKLVRLPVGCGEQNMVLFAPNIFVMDYLTAMDKITEEIKEECLNNMKTGYQRELQYRHEDGSYSAFGPKDEEGSLWLTAFVLRSFGQARRFISIDEHDLSLSRSWILKRQFENGCFEPSGTVFQKEMKGGLKNGDQSLAPLTSYVLISLLESEAERLDTAVVQTALQCLETESEADNYALALFAYASALAKRDEMATAYLEDLDKRAINKDYVKYWQASSNSKSVAVEIAGYYILSRLRMESTAALEKVLPVVRWISQQRNSEGGFVSTQDTVVALQALATYGTYESKKPLDIALAVETDDMTKGFKLDESNKLVTQTFKITDLPTTVDLDAYGDGCAIVQFSLRYNVEKMFNPEGLELNINSRRRGSSECNLPSLGICMRYAIHKEKTNMAVLSVKLPSGFVADEWSLLLLKNDEDVKLMRHEINDNEVNLYFEEITNEAKCFEFNIKSAFEVEDVKPSIIRLYDYYQPERQVTKEYLIPTECNTVALPDLTWLPIFNPLPEYDNLDSLDIPDILNVDSQEMQEISEIPDQQEQQILVPMDEIKDSSPVDKLPEYKNINENFEDMAIFSDAKRDQGDESTTNQTESTLHLSNFADIDQDLDFPDGLEANMPVSVKPPDFENLNCPVCASNIPENFAEIYCNSAFALKVMKRDSTSKTVKILQDISSYVERPKSLKKFGELEYDEGCVCTQLQEKGKFLFIVGSPTNLWDTGEKKHKIRLTSSVHVLLVLQRQINSFLTEAITSCNDDP